MGKLNQERVMKETEPKAGREKGMGEYIAKVKETLEVRKENEKKDEQLKEKENEKEDIEEEKGRGKVNKGKKKVGEGDLGRRGTEVKINNKKIISRR